MYPHAGAGMKGRICWLFMVEGYGLKGYGLKGGFSCFLALWFLNDHNFLFTDVPNYDILNRFFLRLLKHD